MLSCSCILYLDWPPMRHISTPLQNEFTLIINFIQQLCWYHFDVMGGRVVFCKIVVKILGSRLPYDVELILLYSVLHLIKKNIHSS